MSDFREDPRMKVARRSLVLAWSFYAAYLTVMLGASYLLGSEPLVWGLPAWVAVGNVIVPVVFVVLLVVTVELGIPDVPLTDREARADRGEEP